ncbi:HNH endonuclease [Listeria monocytogenes]|nr:HNH endonuclease [Listeria monocytogenes]
MPPRLTIEVLKQRFSDDGWELLENEARGSMVSYKAKCPCGNITRKSPKELGNRKRCKLCTNREKAAALKLSIEEVSALFKENGLELMEDNYVNSKKPLKCRCICGDTTYKTVDSVRAGNLCKKCGYEKIKDFKYSNEEVTEILADLGLVLLENGPINQRYSIRYTCSCGREGKSIFRNILKGSRCKECQREKMTGENSPNYKPWLTEEERANKRIDIISSDWSRRVKERDDYKCQVCGYNQKLQSHHLNSYISDKEGRTDLDNGVTLCTGCHKEFHQTYGYGENTRDQFFTFLASKWGCVDIESA